MQTNSIICSAFTAYHAITCSTVNLSSYLLHQVSKDRQEVLQLWSEHVKLSQSLEEVTLHLKEQISVDRSGLDLQTVHGTARSIKDLKRRVEDLHSMLTKNEASIANKIQSVVDSSSPFPKPNSQVCPLSPFYSVCFFLVETETGKSLSLQGHFSRLLLLETLFKFLSLIKQAFFAISKNSNLKKKLNSSANF